MGIRRHLGPYYSALLFGMNNGVPWSDPRMNPTHLNFDDPAFIEGIQFYADLANRHRVAPTASEAQSMATTDLFTSGHAAMALGGHWRYQTLDRAKDLDFDIAVLPTGPKGHAAHSNIGTTGLAIAASSPRKKQAWEFLKFAAGPVGQAVIAESGLFVPVLTSVIHSAGFAQAHKQDRQSRSADRRACTCRGPAGHPGVAEDRRAAGPQRRPCAARRPARDNVDGHALAPHRRGAPNAMTAVDMSAATAARRRGPSKRRARAGRLFVAPNLTAVAVFMLFPLGFSLYMSVHRLGLCSPRPSSSGWRITAACSPKIRCSVIAMRNTVVYVVGTVVPTVLISLAVAGVLNRKIKGIGIFRTIIFLPLAVSSVVIAVVWQFVFNTNNGLLNIILGWVGIGPVPWLVDPKWAMTSLCIVSVWRSVPFATVILLAAMQGVPENLYEAARLDGAGELRQFVSITVPLIRGAVSFVVVISIIHAFQAFDLVYVLTGRNGGPETATYVLGIMLFQHAFAFLEFGYASALGVGDVRHLAGADRGAVAARASSSGAGGKIVGVTARGAQSPNSSWRRGCMPR